MNDEVTSLGLWLSQHRKSLDLTQLDLARMLGCSESTIKKIEEGKRRPSKQVAELLAGFLEIPDSERDAFMRYARLEPRHSQLLAEQTDRSPASPASPTTPYARSNGELIPTAQVHPPASISVPGHLRHLTRPNNLPAPPNAFIGREREVAAAAALLSRPGVRFLSLTGPPGIGKTRLSLEVAATLLDEFSDGIFFVPLAPVSDPRLFISTIAQALDVREVARRSLLDSLRNYLRPKHMLLVLDNFEQIVSAASEAADLLAAAPALKVLVTSRAVLHMYGEHEMRLPPLALPPVGARHASPLPPLPSHLDYEAVALFVERAQAVNPELTLSDSNAQAVAEICYLLDGLPLAIELAAARARFLTPQAILQHLAPPDGRLKTLKSGAKNLPPRQQTLRGAIAWSYDLLDEDERRLFRRMAIFVGGCITEAAEAVAWGGIEGSGIRDRVSDDWPTTSQSIQLEDAIASLVDKSLLRQEDTLEEESRFGMLETIREYGLEKLAELGELERMQEQHARYFLALAERAEPQLRGRDQAVWLERLDTELDNLRAALHTFEKHADWASALRMSGALGWFWFRRGHLSEGRERLSYSLQSITTTESQISEANSALTTNPKSAIARALFAAGRLAEHQGDNTSARQLYEDSQKISRELGDMSGVGHAICGLAFVYYREGNHAKARELYEEGLAIFRETGDKLGVAIAVRGLGDAALRQGDPTQALALYAESLALFQQIEDKYSIATLHNGLGNATLDQGDYAKARALYEEGLAIFRELRYKYGIAGSLLSLGEAERCLRNYRVACSLNEESVAIWRELGEKWNMAMTLHNLGHSVHNMGDGERAGAIFMESLGLFQEVGAKVGIGMCLAGLAGVAATQRQFERAAILFGAANALLEASGVQLQAADLADYDRNMALTSTQLGSTNFNSTWERGRQMPVEQAVAFAVVQTVRV